jgi:hypothetical protein
MSYLRLSRPMAGLVAAGCLVAAPAAHAATPRPDLAASKLASPPASVTPGQSFSLSATVANNGRRAAGGSVATVLLSKDKKRGKSDLSVGSVKTRALKKGKHVTLKLKVKLPAKLTSGSYYVLLCVDAKHKVKESSEGNNCRASARKLTIKAKSVPVLPAPAPTVPAPVTTTPAEPAPPVNPALALHVDDGLDYGFRRDSARVRPTPGDAVTTTLRMGNGIAGQQGYDRTSVPAEPLATGTGTALDFPYSIDDDNAEVSLASGFPFAGVTYTGAEASTNGWLSFGSAGMDYYSDVQGYDYRGAQEQISQFYRGLMPWWSDLYLDNTGALTATPGSVKTLSPGDGTIVVQWHARQIDNPSAGRDFQAVLYPDGRVRYDYAPGQPAGLSNDEAIVGLASGNGAGTSDIPAADLFDVPGSSVLYTPKTVVQAPAPAGTVRTTIPPESTFVSADDGCTLVSAPTDAQAGVVECAVPALAPGATAVRQVTWTLGASPDDPTRPENQTISGTYKSGGSEASDYDEAPFWSSDLSTTTVTAAVAAGNPSSATDTDDPVSVDVSAPSPNGPGLHNPVLTVTVPAGVRYVSTTLPRCSGIGAGSTSGGTLTCHPTNGMTSTSGSLVVQTTASGAFPISAHVTSDNAPATDGQDTITTP